MILIIHRNNSNSTSIPTSPLFRVIYGGNLIISLFHRQPSFDVSRYLVSSRNLCIEANQPFLMIFSVVTTYIHIRIFTLISFHQNIETCQLVFLSMLILRFFVFFVIRFRAVTSRAFLMESYIFCSTIKQHLKKALQLT